MYSLGRFLKVSFAVAFAIAGIAALIGAIFFDATHQYLMASISAIIVIICISEIKTDKKNENIKS